MLRSSKFITIMSHIALARGLKLLHHLAHHGPSRFKDLAELLMPISPASQMRLLQTLLELGEVEKEGSSYRIAGSGLFESSRFADPFTLSPDARRQMAEKVRQMAHATSYSAALFAWVSTGTMKMISSYAPIGTEVRYRPEGQEWPLMPVHDFAQVFLAYAPDFYREDAYFRWHRFLNVESRMGDFEAFLERLERIRARGYTLSDETRHSHGSLVVPIRLHQETVPRFALGILLYDDPTGNEIDRLVKELKGAAEQVGAALKEEIVQRQLEFDLDKLRKIVDYREPREAW